MPLRYCEVMLSSLSSLLWASPTSLYSTMHFGPPYSIVLRSSTWIMRPPKFIYIPFTDIPSLLTPTTPHNFDRLTLPLYAPCLIKCGYRFRHIRKAHQSQFRVTKPVCSLALRSVCSLQGTWTQPSLITPSRETSRLFCYRPNGKLTGWILTNWYIDASWRTRLTQSGQGHNQRGYRPIC
jgi:hypothetical protein